MTSLALVLVCLVALTVVATVLANGQNHRWSRAANRVCAREHARLAALPARRLGPVVAFERRTLIEEDALAGLKRLDSRTHVQKNYVAWREYEVKLDVWVVGELARGDRARAALGMKRLDVAREYLRRTGRRLGARACAKV